MLTQSRAAAVVAVALAGIAMDGAFGAASSSVDGDGGALKFSSHLHNMLEPVEVGSCCSRADSDECVSWRYQCPCVVVFVAGTVARIKYFVLMTHITYYMRPSLSFALCFYCCSLFVLSQHLFEFMAGPVSGFGVYLVHPHCSNAIQPLTGIAPRIGSDFLLLFATLRFK